MYVGEIQNIQNLLYESYKFFYISEKTFRHFCKPNFIALKMGENLYENSKSLKFFNVQGEVKQTRKMVSVDPYSTLKTRSFFLFF